MQGTAELVLSLYGGKEPYTFVIFFGETINTRACGCRPGDAGEYRFWNAWGLKVPKTCTPPRPPGHAGDCRTCAVSVWREGTLHVRYSLGGTISTWACGCRPGDAGEYRFWNAWGLKVPKTCTPPRPPGHAGELYTELVLSLYGGKEPYTFVTSSEKQSIRGLAGAGPGTRGSTGFGTLGA